MYGQDKKEKGRYESLCIPPHLFCDEHSSLAKCAVTTSMDIVSSFSSIGILFVERYLAISVHQFYNLIFYKISQNRDVESFIMFCYVMLCYVMLKVPGLRPWYCMVTNSLT